MTWKTRHAGWILLAILLLASSPLQAAWLEGLRWFEHGSFTRVVFDLSEAVEFRVAPALDKGYVDVILQGELSRRMPEEKAIGARGVISARQLRATSTSLTWRILCEDVTRVSKMALDESPYKVVVDFHFANGASERSVTEPKPKAAPAQVRGEAKPTSEPRATEPTVEAARREAESRYVGLAADPKRRLIVGELLLQLGDTLQALPQLEQTAQLVPSHPYTTWLLSMAYLATGDRYRAKRSLERLVDDGDWGDLAKERLAALTPAKPTEPLPGGDIREADLGEFIDILRKGRDLAPQDLYTQPSPPRSGRGFWPGLLLGSLLGLIGWGLQQLWIRQSSLERKRQAIVRDSKSKIPDPAPAVAGLGAVDYADVSRRVREELEQHMRDIQDPVKPSADLPITEEDPLIGAEGDDESLSLEDRVYRMADQRRSIVEIAEELNMGVDEVRLVLELREQAGQLGNS